MKALEINTSDVCTYIGREYEVSHVRIKFSQNDIEINASMFCAQSLEAEKTTKHKILTYLGFSKEQIKDMDYE